MADTSTTGIPCFSAGHIFYLRNIDRNRPLQLKDTKEEVVYVGYTENSQIIVHPVNKSDSEFLMIVSGGNLENVPEENVTYIKVSDQPFDGGIKVIS
jgi:hypothetical protein